MQIKVKAWIRRNSVMALLVGAMVLLSVACSNSNNAAEGGNSPAGSDNGQAQAGAAERPKYLPADFPFPGNSTITLTHSDESEGKKLVTMTFKTTESFDKVVKMYQEYLQSRGIENEAETVTPNDLIIQGESPRNKEAWSIIGGPLSSEEGVVELIVSWSEL